MRKTVAGTAADPTLPRVELTIRGKKLYLCYDFNAIALAESLAGTNLLAALDFKGINARQFLGLFYAALHKLQPQMTIEEAGSLIGFDTVESITAAIVEAYQESVPKAKESPKENPPQPGD